MRKRTNLLSLGLSAVLCILAFGTTAIAQENIVYPSGANVLSATRSPYNAKGDGVADDTQALINCIDDAKAQKNVCYIPNGTYLVSNTLTYKVSAMHPRYKAEENAYVRIQGQSRDGVIIKLKNNLNFKRPVISTIKEGTSNVAFAVRVANLTVDTGVGNPAAVGIRYTASNGGVLRHVTIKSSDGKGSRGLDLVSRTGPTYLHHIKINGFDTGIYAPDNPMTVLEHIELNNQNTVGVFVAESSITLRKLISNNSVPALINQSEGQTIIIDSELNGGSNANSAVVNKIVNGKQAHLVIRNVKTSGYARVVHDRGINVPGHRVTEFSSHGFQKLWTETPDRTLNLPIKDTPEVPSSATAEWALVDAYGAVGDGRTDDTTAIQRAMNSGKSTIYFQPGKKYKVTKTITIGGDVRRIDFNYAVFTNIPLNLTESLFKIVDGTAPVVLLQEFQNDFEYYTVVEQATKRTLVMREFLIKRGAAYKNSVTGGEVFIENVPAGVKEVVPNPPYEFTFRDQKVWARNLNPEHHYHALNDGSLLWVLGFKTEADAAIVTTINGGMTELMGGLKWSGGRLTGRAEEPCIINDNSHVSATFFEAQGGSTPHAIDVPVSETRGTTTRTLAASRLGRRTTKPGFTLPLYVGYNRTEVNNLICNKFKLCRSNRTIK